MSVTRAGTTVATPRPSTPPPATAAKPKPPPAAAPESSFKPTAAQKKEREAQLKSLKGSLEYMEVPAETRDALLAKLKTLPPAEFQREVALLTKNVESPNAARAAATQLSLLELAGKSKENAARLTPEIREALVRGVLDERVSGNVGKEGILGQASAQRAAEALIKMSPQSYQQTTELLSKAGASNAASPRADAQTEKALILKAIGARSERLAASPVDAFGQSGGLMRQSAADVALNEVRGFADGIRGQPKDAVIRSTTPLDLEHLRNDSQVDPGSGRVRDGQGDNDGLYQRYLQTCAPTVAMTAKAEADPVYARALNSSPQFAAAEQVRILKEAKGQGVDPRSRHGKEIMLDATKKAKELGFDQDKWNAMENVIRGKDQGFYAGIVGKLALKELRAADGGHPTDAEIGAIRADGGDEKTQMNLDDALNSVTSGSTGIKYTDVKVTGSNGLSTGDLDQMDANLRAGKDVPMRLGDADGKLGHFVMVSDSRGSSPNRNYLVSDPWSGKTAWVKESDLLGTSGESTPWTKRQFGLDQVKVTHTYLEKRA